MSPPKNKRRSQNDSFREVPIFSDVINGATHTHVIGVCYIPLTMVRRVVLSVVLRLKTVFQNTGFKAISYGAVVFRLSGTLMGEPHRLFSSTGMSELEFM